MITHLIFVGLLSLLSSSLCQGMMHMQYIVMTGLNVCNYLFMYHYAFFGTFVWLNVCDI